MSKIIGIDLGTTNSLAAVVVDGIPQIIPDGDQHLVPSVVGLSADGELLVGQAAKNQYTLFPEKTVKSVKRKMGSAETILLGDKEYKPQEISAIILRRLKKIAEDFLEESVERAVITVPAYFSDAQRQATKDAGEIAGLEVVRIINEPTAASLAHSLNKEEDQLVMVYDLGGGTFDVSVVEINSGIVEVRASHGNNHLGGDDFDAKIVESLIRDFEQTHNIDLSGDMKSFARLNRAAEEAKISLSDQPFTQIVEEFIAKRKNKSLHINTEFSRNSFNDMIDPLVRSTLDSIKTALDDSELKPEAIEKVLMVGGSTRIPLVAEVVKEMMEKELHSEINPDECVAIGAAIQAAIIAGENVDSILVDVTPYSLGIEVVEVEFGNIREDRYSVILRKNTVIPVTKSEVYYTMHPLQTKVEIDVFQGEHKTASKNILLGSFVFENIPVSLDDKPAELIVRFDLDINGILHVSATHKDSGKKEQITVKTSQIKLSETEKEEARNKILSMGLSSDSAITTLINKAQKLTAEMQDGDDKDRLEMLIAKIKNAVRKNNPDDLENLKEKLLDKLFELE